VDDGTAVIDCVVSYPKRSDGKHPPPLAQVTDTVAIVGAVKRNAKAPKVVCRTFGALAYLVNVCVTYGVRQSCVDPIKTKLTIGRWYLTYMKGHTASLHHLSFLLRALQPQLRLTLHI
jgi:hypothetical protein